MPDYTSYVAHLVADAPLLTADQAETIRAALAGHLPSVARPAA